jgi:hypothetical protein
MGVVIPLEDLATTEGAFPTDTEFNPDGGGPFKATDFQIIDFEKE